MERESSPTRRTRLAFIQSAAALSVGILFYVAPAALSQDETQPTEVKKLEPVVVTGSNIPRLEAEPIAPVLRIDRQALDQSGASTVSDAIRKLPQNSAGSFAENNANSFTPGSSGVSLRGLGQQSTLVLINGRRVAPYGFGQNINGVNAQFVDLNSIPLAAVERIEILKDSGSAIYGSDAIAGVVNIILRKDYTGVEVSGQYGNTDNNDAGEQIYTFVGGLATEKASVMFFTDYYDRNAEFLRDRPNSNNANQNPRGLDFRSSRGPNATIFDPFTGNLLFVPPTGATNVNQLSSTPFPNSRYNFNQAIVDYPETTRYGGYTIFDYKITDNLSFFVEAGYRKILTHFESAATPIVGDEDGYTVGPDNPYNIYAGITNAPITFRWRPLQAGPRIDDINTDVIRALPGLRLAIGENWHVETAFLYSLSETLDNGSNFLREDKLQAALNDSDPATALNVFGGEGYLNNPATIEGLKTRTTREAKSELMIYDIKANGRLWDAPGGPVGVAFGGETRYESISDVPDTASSNFEIVSSGGVVPSRGSRDSDALYGEVTIPFFSSENAKPGLESLELQLAGRFEYYSDFGTTTKPKIGVKWGPTKELLIRASYSQGFRAPTLSELFLTNIGFQDGLVDTLRCPDPNDVTDPDCGSSQYRIVSGGSSTLAPEQSESWYIGMSFQPPVIKGLTVSLDFTHIKVIDVIQAQSLQEILDRPLGQQAGVVDRRPPSAQDIINGEPGTILSIDQRLINLSKNEVDSVDLGLQYIRPTDIGDFTFDVNATYIPNWSQKIGPGFTVDQVAGEFDIPKIRGYGSVFWNYKGFSVGPTVNYTGDYQDSFLGRRIREYITVDLQASYDGPWETTYTVGVLNVSDEKPPLSTQNTEGYDTAIHDNRGRFYYVRVAKKF